MRLLPFALILGVAACQSTTTAPVAPLTPAEAACGADGYAGLVGTNVAAATFPSDLWYRVIYPDMSVTQDYVPERLNFDVDAAGVVQRLYCG